ncbi:unnamed protein product [Rotaria socialis]|uniref:Dynein attachment factor N-terminal domain-containing protein n=1 Tax=Rotaria socialis TaxID=392032 RepID=A0A820D4T8_9BILA|nr:unnamed protein product [Rotaria socialis]CAF3319160.1 unnamed protein product [Rotaria socialis]CAF3355410.1 unnamed protein product [Rotaria socialis]CAF3450192.1 unnamed protein product [Rotaria socialis]CAF3524051.1 unnamed protein product [Rotaria socialis]
MAKPMKPIDLRKLAANFAKEKSKEERYWQQNDAKFRAVHQRCTSYDEFRQIVDAAHLRPLDRNETLTLERRPVGWNQPAAANSVSSSNILTSSEPIVNHQIAFSTPKNVTEFMQQWRRISPDIKLDYLRRLKTSENIFLTDIPADLLQELPLLYQSNASYNDGEIILDVLVNLSKSKRFELVKAFLNDKDKFELDLLFSRLCSFVNLRFSVFLLRNVYL